MHGDDFVSVGRREDVQWFRSVLSARFEIKTCIVGSRADLGEAREGKVLNRIVRCTEEGFELEADQRHADMICAQLGMEDARPLSSTGEPSGSRGAGAADPELDPSQASLFRSVGARANYLSQDRVDIIYATNEVCRHMSAPTVGAMKSLKHLARYLIHRPRLIMHYKWQGENNIGSSDSDLAGCKSTGKITSNGCITKGSHFLKGWFKKHQCVTR